MQNTLKTACSMYEQFLAYLKPLDGIPSLLIRLYLVPIFWFAGSNKLNHFSDTVGWFGDSLGLPFPSMMVAMVICAEMGGAIFLALGLLTRWVSIPLIITMLVAIFAVHWPNGWQAIADASAPFANAQVLASTEKLEAANAILQEHGNYDWLTSSGSFAIINNGIEFAVTYLIMLLALIKMGGGRYVSLDYWMCRLYSKRK